MNGIERRSVLRHGLGVAAVLGATAGLVALKVSGLGAQGAPEPTRGSDPVLDAVRTRLSPSAPASTAP